MCTPSLQDLCLAYVSENFSLLNINDVKVLPLPILRSLVVKLSPFNLRRLEISLQTPDEVNQPIWMAHYANNFAINYRRTFKVTETTDNLFCVVDKSDGDFRQKFMEDHFHILLEDANKISILLERGVAEVNVYRDTAGSENERTPCDVRMKEIKSDMMLCAPFVRSLKIFRTKVLVSPLLKEVLDILTQSVLCIRLVFLHDYQLLRETLDHFVKNGNILDLHTVWQPQRSLLPSKYSVQMLTLLSGLQMAEGSEDVDLACTLLEEPVAWDKSSSNPTTDKTTNTSVEMDNQQWDPYDLYDVALSGSRISNNTTDEVVNFECSLTQTRPAATHISISSFILTQNSTVHDFIANTLLDRWTSLKSFKLACQHQIDTSLFLPVLLKLIAQCNLRSICFEDTQFTNPMELFTDLMDILIRHGDIVMEKVTLLGIGHPFRGDFSSLFTQAGNFEAIRLLDLSFTSLGVADSLPTFCEYIKRDKALRSLNLNCCKLPRNESTAALLESIGMSQISELILDFNQINGDEVEAAMVKMLEGNRHMHTLSCSLCDFRLPFLREKLLPALAVHPNINKLYLAENKIGSHPSLKNLIIELARKRSIIGYLDLSSNLLNADFLCDMLKSLRAIQGHRRKLFKGLNLSFNIDRNGGETTEYLRKHFLLICEHFLCMALHEEHLEHVAQM